MTKQIPLTQGKFSTVSDDDYERVVQHKWCVISNGENHFYAVRGTSDGRRQTLAAFVLGSQQGTIVDHIDGNTLNNERPNLRVATDAENSHNTQKRRTPGLTSQYKGVCWNAYKRKWAAAIQANYKRLILGYFDSEVDAAKAYDVEARKQFGEFARLNFPEVSHAASR